MNPNSALIDGIQIGLHTSQPVFQPQIFFSTEREFAFFPETSLIGQAICNLFS